MVIPSSSSQLVDKYFAAFRLQYLFADAAPRHDRLFRVLEFLMITLATSLEPALRGQPFDYFIAGDRAS